MSKADEILGGIQRIKSATANVAQDIRNLGSKIEAGMSQAQVDAILAEVNASADALEAVAAETEDETTDPETPEEEGEE